MSSAIIAAGIIAVAGAGTAMYSANQAKKNRPGMAAALDPTQVQKDVLGSNLANQADIEKLTSSTNTYNQGEAKRLMEMAMPGYGSLSGKLTRQAEKLAANPYDVPQDVQANLQRLAAEKGVSTGRSGQAGQFSLLRDLGVNQLQYGQTALGQASSITQLLSSIAPKVNPMSPMSMYLTPGEALGVAQNNQSIQQGGLNAQAAANNANAQATANMWGQIGGIASGLTTTLGAKLNTSNNSFGMTNAQYTNFVNTPMGTNPTPQVDTNWSFNKNG